MKTTEAARHRWKGILKNYGVDEAYLTGKHGPCPLCGEGKDRFRFLDYQGSGSWVCNQCQPTPADGMDFLEAWTGKDFKALCAEVDEIVGAVSTDKPAPKKDPSKRIEHVAAKAKPLDGTDPASLYLQARGITSRSKHIRYLDSYAYYEDGEVKGRYPAMVCRVSSADMRRETFHLIYLDGNGGKAPVRAPKKSLPPMNTINGCAVYLGSAKGSVLLTEGVETGLAAMDLFGLPAVATLTAGGMKSWTPPEGVESVCILADNDASFTGQAAAYHLANRLYRRMAVDVIVPPTPGTDFCDVMTAVTKQDYTKAEIWQHMKDEQPDMAQFVRECREKFGAVKLVEYSVS